jgi:uncharacterized lipoprotein NlpE involved in copper resistance
MKRLLITLMILLLALVMIGCNNNNGNENDDNREVTGIATIVCEWSDDVEASHTTIYIVNDEIIRVVMIGRSYIGTELEADEFLLEFEFYSALVTEILSEIDGATMSMEIVGDMLETVLDINIRIVDIDQLITAGFFPEFLEWDFSDIEAVVVNFEKLGLICVVR